MNVTLDKVMVDWFDLYTSVYLYIDNRWIHHTDQVWGEAEEGERRVHQQQPGYQIVMMILQMSLNHHPHLQVEEVNNNYHRGVNLPGSLV